MYVMCFLEEPSVEAALTNLLPKLLPEADFQFIVFQGKRDLLQNLSSRLRGYANWLPEDWRIIVLVDEDRENCLELKRQLESASLSAGYPKIEAARQISQHMEPVRNRSHSFQVFVQGLLAL